MAIIGCGPITGDSAAGNVIPTPSEGKRLDVFTMEDPRNALTNLKRGQAPGMIWQMNYPYMPRKRFTQRF